MTEEEIELLEKKLQTNKEIVVDKIDLKLYNVVTIFENLFEKPKKQDGTEDKHSIIILLDKQKDLLKIKAVQLAIENAKKAYKVKKVDENFSPFQDGDKEGEDGNVKTYFAGKMKLKAKVPMKREPQVVNRDLTPMTADTNLFRPGSIANVMVKLLFATPKGTNTLKLSCRLECIQYVAPGEYITVGKQVFADKEFDKLDMTQDVSDEEIADKFGF